MNSHPFLRGPSLWRLPSLHTMNFEKEYSRVFKNHLSSKDKAPFSLILFPRIEVR